MDAVSKFRHTLNAANRIMVLTGAGISAESGIPTFRGAGGLWRNFNAQHLATKEAFDADPGLVWEFYHHRREVVASAHPNRGHFALVALERKLREQKKNFCLVTQNIDRLHQQAGSINVTELHGSLWLVKRVCENSFIEKKNCVWEDRRMPICESLRGKGAPTGTLVSEIEKNKLPHIDHDLLRPAVVWFGEQLDTQTLLEAHTQVDTCDLMLVVGTSSSVYPAAGFAMQVISKGAEVCEVNLEETKDTEMCTHSFQGKSGELLPFILDLQKETFDIEAAYHAQLEQP